jgi:hypothetical protein
MNQLVAGTVRYVPDFQGRSLNTVNEVFQFEAARHFENTGCFYLIISIWRLAQSTHFSSKLMLILWNQIKIDFYSKVQSVWSNIYETGPD